MTPEDRPAVVRLIGVYNAEGTVRGELAYWVGRRLGRAHCGLCDITHGSVRERPDWRASRSTLPVPFDTFHRDDQPAGARAVVGDDLPAVLADMSDGAVVRLLGPHDLDACHGSPDALVEAIHRALAERGLPIGCGVDGDRRPDPQNDRGGAR